MCLIHWTQCVYLSVCVCVKLLSSQSVRLYKYRYICIETRLRVKKTHIVNHNKVIRTRQRTNTQICISTIFPSRKVQKLKIQEKETLNFFKKETTQSWSLGTHTTILYVLKMLLRGRVMDFGYGCRTITRYHDRLCIYFFKHRN